MGDMYLLCSDTPNTSVGELNAEQVAAEGAVVAQGTCLSCCSVMEAGTRLQGAQGGMCTHSMGVSGFFTESP